MNTNRKDAELVITEYIREAPLAMYDLGVGINSEWHTLREVYPRMQVYGCEPNAAEYARIVREFPGGMMRLLQVAIGAEHGVQRMVMMEEGNGGSTLFVRPDHANKPSAMVGVETLDGFDAWAGKPDKILLWMDIEGSELDALRGGHELMSSGRVRWISAEVYDDPPKLPGYPSAREIGDLLRAYGYTKVRDYNHQGSHYDVIYTKD